MTAEDYLPDRINLSSLEDAAASCRGCGLYRNASQTVFGEGLVRSRVMLVGEQPGDQEDRRGKPFVGPAGRLLAEALEEAGIRRNEAYITNVVKHFKHERRGKRRIHKRPAAEEIRACMPWLEAEVGVVTPEVIVALGATAAQALLGRDFRLTRHRGDFHPSELGPQVTATVHPSSVLRAPTSEDRREALEAFVKDLRTVAHRLA